MIIKSKVTTLQVVKDSALVKPYVNLNNSTHSIKEIIPVIIDINSNKTLKINDINLVFKLIHPTTGIVLRELGHSFHFLFSQIQPDIIKAEVYLNTYTNESRIQDCYEKKGLDFSFRTLEIYFELNARIKINQEQPLDRIINTGSFYVY